jgi:hypothetical protein
MFWEIALLHLRYILFDFVNLTLLTLLDPFYYLLLSQGSNFNVGEACVSIVDVCLNFLRGWLLLEVVHWLLIVRCTFFIFFEEI